MTDLADQAEMLAEALEAGFGDDTEANLIRALAAENRRLAERVAAMTAVCIAAKMWSDHYLYGPSAQADDLQNAVRDYRAAQEGVGDE